MTNCDSCGGTGITGFGWNNEAVYCKKCKGLGKLPDIVYHTTKATIKFNQEN